MTLIQNQLMAGRCLMPTYVARPGDIVSGWHISAMLDTGATQSAVTAQMAEMLGLPTGGPIDIAASGIRATHNSYMAHLEFWQASPTNMGVPMVFPNLDLCRLISPISGVQVLIGMDVLGTATRFEIHDGIWRLEW